MKITVGEERELILTQVYNSVVFKSDDNQELIVCMRDGGFEIAIKDYSIKANEIFYKWFRINLDGISEMFSLPKQDKSIKETSCG